MNWGKSFTYVFDDKDWIAKVLIGGILSLVPVVNLVVIGYGLRVLKNVATGVEDPLPNWDDFVDYFVKGLFSMLGALVWALPLIILITISGVISMLTGYDSSESSRVAAPFVVCIWGLACVSGLYGLFLGFVLPAALAHYAVREDFAAFFRFGDIFRLITSNLGNYIIALVLYWVALFIAGFGVILCIIGTLFTEFWSTLVGAHLLGQVYRATFTPTVPAVEPTV